MIVADLRILTVGENASLEEPVEKALEVLDEKGIKYEVGAMGTVLEASDLDTLLDAVKECHRAVREVAPRVFTQFTIDERQDKEETAESLAAVKH